MDFLQLAQQAQKELDGEKNRVAQKEAKLDAKASQLADQEAALLKFQGELKIKEKELQNREDVLVTKETIVRRDAQAQSDFDQATALRESAANALKKAEEIKAETNLALEELAKREQALSDREATYQEEIKKKIAAKMLGI